MRRVVSPVAHAPATLLRSASSSAAPCPALLLRSPAAAPSALFARGLAKKAAAKGKKGAVAEAARTGPAENVETLVRGLNIFKDAPDEVKVKPDAEYPEWVFTLHMPRATLDELASKYEEDPNALEPWDAKRMIKQWNRRRIKEGNEAKAKK